MRPEEPGLRHPRHYLHPRRRQTLGVLHLPLGWQAEEIRNWPGLDSRQWGSRPVWMSKNLGKKYLENISKNLSEARIHESICQAGWLLGGRGHGLAGLSRVKFTCSTCWQDFQPASTCLEFDQGGGQLVNQAGGRRTGTDPLGEVTMEKKKRLLWDHLCLQP